MTIRDAASPPRFKRHVATVLGPMGHLAHSSMLSGWYESDGQGMLQLVKPAHDLPVKGPVAGTEAQIC